MLYADNDLKTLEKCQIMLDLNLIRKKWII